MNKAHYVELVFDNSKKYSFARWCFLHVFKKWLFFIYPTDPISFLGYNFDLLSFLYRRCILSLEESFTIWTYWPCHAHIHLWVVTLTIICFTLAFSRIPLFVFLPFKNILGTFISITHWCNCSLFIFTSQLTLLLLNIAG